MLAPNIPLFKSQLSNLWDNPKPGTTIYETGDIIQTFWSNSVVAGYEIAPCIVPPNATYAGLLPLVPVPPLDYVAGTAASAAAAFEAACSQMVLATLFTIIPPPFTTPPPVPTGVSLPGLLTTSLTSIFLSGVAPTSSLVVDVLVSYFQSWVILVTIPPAGPVPVPII